MSHGLVGWFRRPRHYLPLLLAGVLVVGLWSLLPAELIAPRPNDRHITNAVTKLLVNDHLTRHPLNDEISQRGFKAFLKTLDPMKLYFYQSDVDEFLKQQNQLDDMLQDKDLNFAYKVYQRFLARVEERVKVVDELLNGQFDFTLPESLVTDPEKIQYPKTPQDAWQRWERRIKYDLLVQEGGQEDRPGGPGQAAAAVHEPGQAAAADRSRRAAGDVPDGGHVQLRSAHHVHVAQFAGELPDPDAVGPGRHRGGPADDGRLHHVSKIIPGGAADKHGKLKPDDRSSASGRASRARWWTWWT